MANKKLDDAALSARKQWVAMLRAVARASEGADNDYAARLRAEARMMAKDQDFADMVKLHARYTEIANTVTAATEAFHEKQVRAQSSPKRVVTKPWYADADKIISDLHIKNPGWKPCHLRHGLENQWGLKPGRPELPEPRAIERHIEKLLKKDGSPVEKAK
jgi:hypothetical protein